MGKACRGLHLLAALTLAFSGPASARPEPASSLASSLAFTGYVVDQANSLSPAERERLTRQLGRFERATRHQLAVVTVSSLGGEDIASFTTRLANRWGVGRKGANDGVVLLVAPNDRKVRIAVGRGLERQLTDGLCQAIITTKMIPWFRRGRIGAAVEAGVSAIVERLTTGGRSEREPLAPLKPA